MFRGRQHASLYKAFRPVYPSSLVHRILDFIRTHHPDSEWRRAVDIGCGTGQLTRLLAPYYKQVIGFDESRAQIDQAQDENNSQNIVYDVSTAENINLDTNSTDLVSAAQCIHWLDTDKFYPEVERVLKPNGTLAIVTYGIAKLVSRKGPEVSRRLTKVNDDVHAYFRDNNFMDERTAASKYFGHALTVPFPLVEKDTLYMTQGSSIKDYVGFVSSTSHYNKHMEANPDDSGFLSRIREKLMEAAESTDENYPIVLKYPLNLTMASMEGKS